MKLTELLAGKTTAADIAAALSSARKQQSAAEHRIGELNAALPGALLDAEDAEIDAIEQELTALRRTVNRGSVVVEALARRLAEAEASEHRARLDRLFQQATDYQRASIKLLKDYEQQ